MKSIVKKIKTMKQKILSPKGNVIKLKTSKPKKLKMKMMAVVLASFLSCANMAMALGNGQCNGASWPQAGCVVISPYWQASAANGTYTFMGISHPSLSGSSSQISVRITAIGSTSDTGISPAPNIEFTIASGSTHSVYIVATNNASINSGSITTPNSHFITTTSGANQFGSVSMVNSNLYPKTVLGPSGNSGYADLHFLSMWGVIVNQATNSAWHMEFIGDANDSTQ